MEQHYSLRGQKPARAGPSTQYFSLGDESVPEPVGEPRLQARVQRYTVEHLADVPPMVQILDARVPQMEEQFADNLNLEDDVMDAVQFADLLIAEQVIEVPEVSSSSCPSRAVLHEPQVVEQLMEGVSHFPYGKKCGGRRAGGVCSWVGTSAHPR